MKKLTLITISSLGILTAGILTAGGLLGLHHVSAQITQSEYPSIIENLAERFTLDKDEVAEVFNETRLQRISQHLDQYIEDGTITENQKTTIIEKQEEMREKMQEINNTKMTSDERKEAIQTLNDELEAWAEENDIPNEVIHKEIKGFDGHRGMGMAGKEMMNSF